jgi:hypothetical protein
VGGSSAGVPTVAAPNLGNLTSASNTVAASSSVAQQAAAQNGVPTGVEDVPSIFSVEVLGYGGGEENPSDEEERKKKKKQDQSFKSDDTLRLSSNEGSGPRASGPTLW